MIKIRSAFQSDLCKKKTTVFLKHELFCYKDRMSVISEQTVVFTSVTVQVKNLRNELRLDPVSALATQCTRPATATVWWCVLYCGSSFLQGTMVSISASSSF